MGSEGADVSELCRRFGVSRKTAYKWKALSDSGEPLSDRSRRPLASPRLSSEETEGRVLALRREHPTWGGRKISSRLAALGDPSPPAPSTVTGILRRRGLLDGPGAGEKRDWERFERESPNELWQMDFKGHFPTLSGRCHPLTLADDHSRYLVGVWACGDETADTVRPRLESAFRRHGLPGAILCDNGGPWSSHGGPGLSSLEAWLLRLGVRVLHGRPYHPQTQGKLERLHRTLLADAVRGRVFDGLEDCGRALLAWRDVYNRERPHESLGMDVPLSRYRPSPVPFPESLPEPASAPGDHARKVQKNGEIQFRGRTFRVGGGLAGQTVHLRAARDEEVYEILFCEKAIARLDLRETARSVTRVSARV